MHITRATRILGVSPTSSGADIKAAYRALLLTAHPDKGGNDAQFIDLQDAYKRLTTQTPSVPECVWQEPDVMPDDWSCVHEWQEAEDEDVNMEPEVDDTDVNVESEEWYTYP